MYPARPSLSCAARISRHVVLFHRSDTLISSDDDVTYTVNAITLYKTEPDVVYAGVLKIVTHSSAVFCGIDMAIGSEYFIDLVRGPNGELRAVGQCGGFRPWDEVTDDELMLLEEGCDNYNTCDDCTIFQVRGGQFCEIWRPTPGSGWGSKVRSGKIRGVLFYSKLRCCEYASSFAMGESCYGMRARGSSKPRENGLTVGASNELRNSFALVFG